MAAVEEPKKPPSAYVFFTMATREAIQAEIGSKAIADVAKVHANRWKTMPAGVKAQYERQAEEAKTKYEKDLTAFMEAGGVGKKADKAAKKEAKADKPKKPTAGAFGVYLIKNRPEIAKSLPPGNDGVAVSVAASERWKNMSESDKKPYEEEYRQKKALYDTELKAWQQAKGISAQACKATKPAKANSDKPKMPTAGAFGVYLIKNRPEIAKSLPPGHSCTAVNVAASERWKEMSAGDKKPYEEEYRQKKARYETELKAWKEAQRMNAAEEEDDDGEEEEDEESFSQKADAKKDVGAKKRGAFEAIESLRAMPAKALRGA